MTFEEKMAVIEEAMEVDEGTLTEEMLLGDIDEWDSLAALCLVTYVKREQGRELTTDELMAFQTVKDICD